MQELELTDTTANNKHFAFLATHGLATTPLKKSRFQKYFNQTISKIRATRTITIAAVISLLVAILLSAAAENEFSRESVEEAANYFLPTLHPLQHSLRGGNKRICR